MTAQPLTIHVLVIWPKGHDPNTREATPATPENVFTFIEQGDGLDALTSSQQMAVRHEAFGHRTELVTVPIQPHRPNPATIATELALHEIRTAPTCGARHVTPPTDDAVHAVTMEKSAIHLAAMHDIGLAGDNHDLETVLLRLARRGVAGDPIAEIALAEFAAELRRAQDDTVPPSEDPLTFANAELVEHEPIDVATLAAGAVA